MQLIVGILVPAKRTKIEEKFQENVLLVYQFVMEIN
jgi:hypothetical protein